MPSARREEAARLLLAYLQPFPMGTERRLELALEVLRGLPQDATPDQALTALWPRLPELDPSGFPPSGPAIRRSAMPEQYMGRPRTGIKGFVSRWIWLLFPALLLGLTLVPRYLP